MKNVTIEKTYTNDNESYTINGYDIKNENGEVIGCISTLEDENSCVIDGININEEERGQGYGTAALLTLKEMVGTPLLLVAKNEGAARLYARLGSETYELDDTCGFGVYEI